jgi:methylase of polypeptide subunit release factors
MNTRHNPMILYSNSTLVWLLVLALHPTTRMCCQFLEEYQQAGTRVMDLGCGSGILAIAQAYLGASEIIAIDTDGIAVDATRINAGSQWRQPSHENHRR